MNPVFRLRDPRLCQIAVLTGLMVFGTTVLDLGIRWQNAIGSKFLIRIRGKHVFNPRKRRSRVAGVGLDHAWLPAGQWGSTAIRVFSLACLGFLVLTRAKRAETTITFLAFYGTLLFARALWLGDPMSIPMHQLQNGALLILAFFMISDPKTTPDAALGRVLYAVIVATVAFVIQFAYYIPNGPVLALVLSAPLVPAIDSLLHGMHYQWRAPKGAS